MDSTTFLVIAVIAIAVLAFLLFLALFEPGLAYKISAPETESIESDDFLCVLEAVTDEFVDAYYGPPEWRTEAEQRKLPLADIVDPATGEVILEANEELTPRVISMAQEKNVEKLEVFDPLTRFQCCPPTCGAAAAIVWAGVRGRAREAEAPGRDPRIPRGRPL